MKPRFVSDIHLSEKRPDLTNAFKAFLNESKEACTHLFILGDLLKYGLVMMMIIRSIKI